MPSLTTALALLAPFLVNLGVASTEFSSAREGTVTSTVLSTTTVMASTAVVDLSTMVTSVMESSAGGSFTVQTSMPTTIVVVVPTTVPASVTSVVSSAVTVTSSTLFTNSSADATVTSSVAAPFNSTVVVTSTASVEISSTPLPTVVITHTVPKPSATSTTSAVHSTTPSTSKGTPGMADEARAMSMGLAVLIGGVVFAVFGV